MSVILRVDDFPGTKPPEFWKHNLENFKKFDAVLEDHGISYVLGVIPKYTDRKMITWLAQNERVRVALHGIEHDERFLNEFRDHETELDISQKLTAAVDSISECNGDGKVDCYIPPHNCIDMKTARALARSGFTDLMCGPGTELPVYSQIQQSGLFENLSFSKKPYFYGRTDELSAIDAIFPQLSHAASSETEEVFTLHWTWEMNIGLENLRSFLSRVDRNVFTRV